MKRALVAAAVAGPLLVLTSIACSKREDATPATVTAPKASASAASTTTPSATASAKPAAAKPDTAKRALSAEEKAKLAEYHAGLAAGRKATVAKDWGAAAKGFDSALAARPNDPRALSERGYAKLLARDFKGATADLEKATRGTKDKKLLAQIWYNHGLIAEAENYPASARLFFARSNALNPTKPAADKLAGKSKCPAALNQHVVPGTPKGSWLEVFGELAALHEHDMAPLDDKPKTESEARRVLCEGGCNGDGPWLATVTGGNMAGARAIVARSAAPGGKLLVFSLGTYAYGMCGGELKHTFGSSSGDLLSVKVAETMMYRGWGKLVGDDFVPCDDKDADDACFSACAGGETEERELFFDLAKGAQVLSVDTDASSAHASLVTTKRVERTISLSGAGCAETVTLP